MILVRTSVDEEGVGGNDLLSVGAEGHGLWAGTVCFLNLRGKLPHASVANSNPQ